MIKEYSNYPQESMDNFSYNLKESHFSTNPYLKIIVYVEKDKIIAFLLYSLIYERLEIEQFEVKENKRGQKIGSKLLNYLIEKYKGKVTNITLEVKENNLIALNLYKKFGFQIVSIRKKYYQETDGFLMEKKLK